MAKTVYVVFDTELEKIVGVYDNAEAADDCETASPGDRYTQVMELEKTYNEDEDPRVLNDPDADFDDERGHHYGEELFGSDDVEKDPYGD